MACEEQAAAFNGVQREPFDLWWGGGLEMSRDVIVTAIQGDAQVPAQAYYFRFRWMCIYLWCRYGAGVTSWPLVSCGASWRGILG